MKSKRKKLIESAVSRRAKLLENHVLGLGQLPSSKLMKMKWNPVTNRTLKEQESPADNDLIGDLKSLLANWEDKEHPYYTDVANLVNKHASM